MGLSDELRSTLRSQTVMLVLLPPFDKIFNMTQQEENHNKVMIVGENQRKTGVAFVVREQTSVAARWAYKICSHYGHEETSCYEVIGYPSCWDHTAKHEEVDMDGLVETDTATIEAKEITVNLPLLQSIKKQAQTQAQQA